MSEQEQEQKKADNSLHSADRIVTGAEIVGRVLIHIASIALAIVAMLALVALVVWSAGGYYDAMHVIHDPVARGEDLGAGLILVFVASISFVASLPIGFYAYRRASKAILKRIYGD